MIPCAATNLRSFLLLAGLLALPGCWQSSGPEVVAYTALDEEFSQPVFADFTAQTGIAVRAKFDTESTKTVGLAQAILAEQARPRCDLFWNNEILHTLRLERQGLLEPYQPAVAASYPSGYRSPNGTWHGFAARARVLVVHRTLVPEGTRPQSVLDLADPRWRGRAAIAKPLFGTTASHAACLFARLGEAEAKAFFRRLKENQVQILSGNKQVALAVADGSAAIGLTDTDDAVAEQDQGRALAIVYPDQGSDQMGTLFLPNTVAIVRGCPHPAEARRLVDALLSPATENRLAAGASAQIPLGSGATVQPRVETPRTVKAMQVDFQAAAQCWDAAARFLRDEFSQ